MKWPVLTVTIKFEHDVVAARRRARQIAGLLGFDSRIIAHRHRRV